VFQVSAAFCNVVQIGQNDECAYTECCSVLQCVAVGLQGGAICYRVLQIGQSDEKVRVRIQCVAVCCRVLQCVADWAKWCAYPMCCSVLQ